MPAAGCYIVSAMGLALEKSGDVFKEGRLVVAVICLPRLSACNMDLASLKSCVRLDIYVEELTFRQSRSFGLGLE